MKKTYYSIRRFLSLIIALIICIQMVFTGEFSITVHAWDTYNDFRYEKNDTGITINYICPFSFPFIHRPIISPPNLIIGHFLIDFSCYIFYTK
jgi:hypothetical protein